MGHERKHGLTCLLWEHFRPQFCTHILSLALFFFFFYSPPWCRKSRGWNCKNAVKCFSNRTALPDIFTGCWRVGLTHRRWAMFASDRGLARWSVEHILGEFTAQNTQLETFLWSLFHPDTSLLLHLGRGGFAFARFRMWFFFRFFDFTFVTDLLAWL